MQNEVVRARLRWLGAGILALWLSSCLYTVNEEEQAVCLRFGKPVWVNSGAGLGVKLPLPIMHVKRVDRRQLVYDTFANEFLTSDKKNVLAECFAVWQITSPSLLIQRCGSREEAEQRLDEHLVSELGAAFGRFNFEELVNVESTEVRIEQLLDQVLRAVNDTVERQQYGFTVRSVRLTRLSYPEATLEQVFQKMRAERKSKAEEYRAEGQKEADIIRSQADREKARILAEAREQADSIRGQGELEAARIFSQSYRQAPDFWRFWRKLEAMKKVIGDDDTFYIPSDQAEILSPLHSAPPGQ